MSALDGGCRGCHSRSLKCDCHRWKIQPIQKVYNSDVDMKCQLRVETAEDVLDGGVRRAWPKVTLVSSL